MIKFPDLPEGCILGLNYSGMHDSAIAIVSPDGSPLFAVSLERISRIKQDGRPPFALLANMPWARIVKVAISAPEQYIQPDSEESKLHPTRLPKPRLSTLAHEPAFMKFFEDIPCEKVFVGHQEAHAASAFWGSGFNEALCLTYDGGMHNDPWFGGLYQCNRQDGILPLDHFNAMHCAKVTTLYTFITALLGFTPNKHEGKITGLAAYGKPTERCLALYTKWFEQEYFEMEKSMHWIFTYDEANTPQLISSQAILQRFQEESTGFSREEMAATVQNFAENHILQILKKAHSLGWHSRNICLAGGLFANVKINQRVVESGFEKLFVAPPMTDDGTALGAAWHVASSSSNFAPKPLHSMFLGPSYAIEEVRALVKDEDIAFVNSANPANEIAGLLADGAVVAVFHGAMEFGPRALGNRSILAPASESDINRSLNERLNRTEFMPFAPMTRLEDADACYLGVARVQHAAEFMTVTVDCTDTMRQTCPAVVHVDGTARPQLVTKNSNPLIHEILTGYKQLTGKLAIVNTSFNIHEEPIVCSPEDALRGFFESGLDYLYMEGVGIIAFAGNEKVAIRYMQQKLKTPSHKSVQLSLLNLLLEKKLKICNDEIEAKEAENSSLLAHCHEKEAENSSLLAHCHEKDSLIRHLTDTVTSLQNVCQERDSLIRHLTDTVTSLQNVCQERSALIKLLDEAVTFLRNGRPKKNISNQGEKIENEELYSIFCRERSSFLLRSKFMIFSWVRDWHLYKINRIRAILSVRLGVLRQHHSTPLILHNRYKNPGITKRTPLKISIVTPCRNHSAFIERTLKSVLDQKYPNLEYFVQDGASEDGTREILQEYSNLLTDWESTADGGQSHAINMGMRKTTGEIMAWLNSDDVLLPGALAYVSDYFRRHPDVDVIYGHRILIDENDQQIGRWMLPAHNNEVLSWSDFIPQETLFWRRRIWDKVGSQVDESFNFAMDWDLLIRFREAGASFACVPRFIGGFRIHLQQKTSANIGDIGINEMNRIRERVLGFVPTDQELNRALFPFLRRHVATDLWWRIRRKLGMPS